MQMGPKPYIFILGQLPFPTLSIPPIPLKKVPIWKKRTFTFFQFTVIFVFVVLPCRKKWRNMRCNESYKSFWLQTSHWGPWEAYTRCVSQKGVSRWQKFTPVSLDSRQLHTHSRVSAAVPANQALSPGKIMDKKGVSQDVGTITLLWNGLRARVVAFIVRADNEIRRKRAT